VASVSPPATAADAKEPIDVHGLAARRREYANGRFESVPELACDGECVHRRSGAVDPDADGVRLASKELHFVSVAELSLAVHGFAAPELYDRLLTDAESALARAGEHSAATNSQLIEGHPAPVLRREIERCGSKTLGTDPPTSTPSVSRDHLHASTSTG
jgi:hypothetical protein